MGLLSVERTQSHRTEPIADIHLCVVSRSHRQDASVTCGADCSGQKVELDVLTTVAVGPQRVPLKMKGKRCVFVAA